MLSQCGDRQLHNDPTHRALLAVAFEGEYWRPTCVRCGIKLVERKPTKGGAAFWGCNHHPRGKTTFKMTAPI